MDIVLIEDEKYTAELLERFCLQYDANNKIVCVLDSVEGAIRWFSSTEIQPDVVFMDVQLSDGLSFEILDKVSLEMPAIFVTAYDEYAIRAFKLNSVDYILKPFDYDEIKKAFQKYTRLKACMASNSGLSLEKMFSGGNKVYKSRFLIKTGERYKIITTPSIAYFSFEEGVVIAQLVDGKQHIVNETLDELEALLDPVRFYRINRKTLVSIDSISSIQSYFNRRLSIRLLPGNIQELVSRDRVPGFKSWMNL